MSFCRNSEVLSTFSIALNWAVARQTHISFQTHEENFRTFLVVSREDDDDDDDE